MTTPKILAFAGSARTDSWNKKLIKIAVEGARAEGADVTLIDMRDYALPLYDGDLEASAGIPEPAMRLKGLFVANHALLISSPEYNSSLPGPLKNLLDWVSRSAPGESVLSAFQDKVAGLVSASPGILGGQRALVALRSMLGNIKTLVIPDQVSVGKAPEAFNPDGTLKDAKQSAAVQNVGKALARIVAKLRS